MIVILINLSLNYLILFLNNKMAYVLFYKDKELRDVNKRYNKNDLRCIVVHGHRAVKMALINEFCKGKL